MKGSKLIADWFSHLDKRIRTDAERAGLFDHPTLTGSAREFIVQELLRSFLPARCGIGSGRVIAATESPSPQIDIVIFDKSFPQFEMPGGSALFPVESVIATIEVKSRLDKVSLEQALDNCFQVMVLGSSAELVQEDMDRYIADAETKGEPKCIAVERALWQSLPRTYVVGFGGLDSENALSAAQDGWISRNGMHGTVNRPFLPSLIVTKETAAFLYSDPLRIGGDVQFGESTISMAEFQDRVFQVILGVTNSFAVLASHLLWTLGVRGFFSNPNGLERSVESYLQADALFRSQISGPVRRQVKLWPVSAGRESRQRLFEQGNAYISLPQVDEGGPV